MRKIVLIPIYNLLDICPSNTIIFYNRLFIVTNFVC